MDDPIALPDHLFRLLEEAGRGFRAEFGAVLAEEGVDLPVRGSRIRVLQLMPRDGSRQVDLAARVRMTKQSLGEILSALEDEGLVSRRPDPADGRAWLVAPTRRGLALSDEVDRLASTAEARLAARVGPRQYAAFRQMLARVAEPAASA